MIVLDTNQLRHAAFPHGPILGMLRKITELHGRELALPEMVVVEHVAHHKHEVERNIADARKALAMLGGAFGRDLTSTIEALSGDEAAQIRRDELEAVFKVLPTPTGAADEALRREANRLPPAEQVWLTNEGKPVKARGARDTAIWLTLLDAAASTEDDVWFVSMDADFGKNDFHPALRAEAEARLGTGSTRLRFLSEGVDQLLKELARPAATPAGLQAMMQSPVVAHALNITISTANLFFGLLPPRPMGSFGYSSSGIVMDELTVKRSKAYTVGDALWVSVHASCRTDKIYSIAYADGQVGIALSPQQIKTSLKFEATLLLEVEGTRIHSAEVLVLGPIFAKQQDDPSGGWTPVPHPRAPRVSQPPSTESFGDTATADTD